MSLLGGRNVTIHGVEIPRRRFTRWAALYFVTFVCVPMMAVALCLDILIYVLLIR